MQWSKFENMNGVISQKWDANGVSGTESEINDVVALISGAGAGECYYYSNC